VSVSLALCKTRILRSFANEFGIRHVKTLVGEIDFSFHALNPSGTNPGGLSMKADDKTE
jgi:hypothetical protein